MSLFYTTTIANCSVQQEADGNKYQVPSSTFLKTIEKWKGLPVQLGHNGQQVGAITDAFINTDGFISHDGITVPANYLPASTYRLYEDINGIRGVSISFLKKNSHRVERQAGFEDVEIIDDIEPLHLAVLVNENPNYRECDIKNNNDILTNKKDNNNNICSNMEEKKETKEKDNLENKKVEEVKENNIDISNINAKLDKILSLLSSKENASCEVDKKEDKKNEDKEDKKEEDKEEDKEEEDKEEDVKNNSEVVENDTNKVMQAVYYYSDLF